MVSYDTRHRRSVRLNGHDYGGTATYFVTLVTAQRESMFAVVSNGEVQLNAAGFIVHNELRRSLEIRQELKLDAFVVMPNHVHAIVSIIGAKPVGAHGRAPLRTLGPRPTHRPPRSLGSFIAGFKSAATRRINELRSTPGVPVWQRNYYEHIIRDEAEPNRIRQYIIDNPAKWDEDPENPAKSAGPTRVEA